MQQICMSYWGDWLYHSVIDDSRIIINLGIKRILKMYRKVSDITGQIYYDCIL